MAFPVHVHAQAANDEDDFWLLLDYQPLQNSLWFYGGIDEDDGNYLGLAAELALIENLYFNFSAGRQNYSVTTEELSWGFSGNINQYLSWQLSRIFWGKKSSLEKNDSRLSTTLFYSEFDISLSYETGDLELFFRDSAFINRDSISSDHHAYEISSAYSGSSFFTRVSYKKHNYEKNLSLLASSPRLINRINPLGIQQASALAESEISLLLGIQVETMTYTVLVSRIKSVVTEDSDSYITLHLSKTLSRHLELGIDAELPVNNVPFSAGVSLGLRW